jgi:nicotinate-nucleotide pyrophosphorylase (carboxylating)
LDQVSVANFVSRTNGVVAGLIIAKIVVAVACDGNVDFVQSVGEGTRIERGSLILSARGNSRGLLLAERSALNFLCHLSGIATLTSRWVAAIEGTGVMVRDTRKTTPGIRDLEKFAVRTGGGTNHRLSLSDAAMIKDNHVLAAGGIKPAFERIRAEFPTLPIEVEVDRFEQITEALEVGADLILLDNMSVAECRKAVQYVSGRARLEASGGITLETARAYAQTGVDYLAIGALTHSAPNLDIGLDLVVE